MNPEDGIACSGVGIAHPARESRTGRAFTADPDVHYIVRLGFQFSVHIAEMDRLRNDLAAEAWRGAIRRTDAVLRIEVDESKCLCER